MEGKVCMVLLKNPKFKMLLSCVDYKRVSTGCFSYMLASFGTPFFHVFLSEK